MIELLLTAALFLDEAPEPEPTPVEVVEVFPIEGDLGPVDPDGWLDPRRPTIKPIPIEGDLGPVNPHPAPTRPSSTPPVLDGEVFPDPLPLDPLPAEKTGLLRPARALGALLERGATVFRVHGRPAIWGE